jgi:hypothetical protein
MSLWVTLNITNKYSRLLANHWTANIITLTQNQRESDTGGGEAVHLSIVLRCLSLIFLLENQSCLTKRSSVDSTGRTQSWYPLRGRTPVEYFHALGCNVFNSCFLLPVAFETFDLCYLVERAYSGVPSHPVRVPESVTNWLDDYPRMALDVHGTPLVLHIPGWQRGKSLVCKLVYCRLMS